jgi:hypothetical protein
MEFIDEYMYCDYFGNSLYTVKNGALVMQCQLFRIGVPVELRKIVTEYYGCFLEYLLYHDCYAHVSYMTQRYLMTEHRLISSLMERTYSSRIVTTKRLCSEELNELGFQEEWYGYVPPGMSKGYELHYNNGDRRTCYYYEHKARIQPCIDMYNAYCETKKGLLGASVGTAHYYVEYSYVEYSTYM